uniref:GTP cyclohydrolase-2 n=1 Tax=Acidicaldus sp. TaxID=1872105 RepID=A0A8J4M4B1_9PROT
MPLTRRRPPAATVLADPEECPAAVPETGGQRPFSEPATLRLRALHRAIADSRRGVPVLLTGRQDFVIAPAETLSAQGLAEFAALAAAAPLLLMAPARAAALLGRPLRLDQAAVAFPVASDLLAPAALRRLADPTLAQILPENLPELREPPIEAAAALALAKLARLLPAMLGAPAGADAAHRAAAMGLLTVPIEDVLAYPDTAAASLRRVAEARVPLADAPDARVVAFRAPDAGIEHLAIVIGRPEAAAMPLVRLHSECFTGDLLGSLRCDCGPQLRLALRRVAAGGDGAVLYLAQEGRGIGLVNKLRAYALQDRGLDTLDANRALGWGADERRFLIAATMLRELGIQRFRLLTNNPDKVAALAACGCDIAGREALIIPPNGVNDRYLATKAARFGHLLP